MSLLYISFVLVLLKIVAGQGKLPNGDPYFCVPPGICPDSGGIDPRIMTPGDIEVNRNSATIEESIQQMSFGRNITSANPTPNLVTCPPGLAPCYAQGSMSNCGFRLLRINSTSDGYAQTGAYPWQAFLTGPTGAYIGSGSLLSPYHVLTATHKVLAYARNASQVTVFMGVNDPALIDRRTPRSAAARIRYLNTSAQPYNNLTLKNDIAIITLATPISLVGQTLINTICLPPASSTAMTYMTPQRCVVSGWGQIQPDSRTGVPTKLKQVAVNTTTLARCASGFAGRVNIDIYLDQTGGQLCAGGEAQKDACFQDGGAPLTCGAGTTASRFTVAGIVIWGKSCGQPGIYGVYTNVPFYRQWIIDVITTRIS